MYVVCCPIASLSEIVLGVLAMTGPVSIPKSSDAEPLISSPESSYVRSALISFVYVWIAGVLELFGSTYFT